MKREQVGDK